MSDFRGRVAGLPLVAIAAAATIGNRRGIGLGSNLDALPFRSDPADPLLTEWDEKQMRIADEKRDRKRQQNIRQATRGGMRFYGATRVFDGGFGA
jgi:hypothetical protein